MVDNTQYSLLPFSVAMCVFDGDNTAFFKQALDSIINQTLKPNQIILVVDGSISASLKNVISSYDNITFLKVVYLPKNVGQGNARRIGLENCSNNLVALMDADDISVPDRFEKQIKIFKQFNDLDVVGGNINEFINSTDNIVGVRLVPQGDANIKDYLKKRCPFNQVTVMFKKSSVEFSGGYIDWYQEEDYYLWIRMCEAGAKFYNIQENLVNVRVGKDMYRRRGGWRYFKSEAKLQMYMYNKNIISFIRVVFNVSIRFVLQVVMPNSLRGFIFQKFARGEHDEKVS